MDFLNWAKSVRYAALLVSQRIAAFIYSAMHHLENVKHFEVAGFALYS